MALTPDDTIEIERELTKSEHDPNALMVFAHVGGKRLLVGYIDKVSAARVVPFQINGAHITASAADSIPVQLDLV